MWKFLFLLCALGTLPGQQAAAGIMPKDSVQQYDQAFWNTIKNSRHPEDYERYLQAYPKGMFAPLARGRIERLRAAAPKAELPKGELPKAEVPPTAMAPPGPGIKPPKKKPRPPLPAKAPPAPLPESEGAASTALLSPPAEKPAAVPPTVKEIRDCPDCPTLVEMPTGLFTMGSDGADPTEKPPHSVALGRLFAIGKQEVTIDQWDACADSGACPPLTADIETSEPDQEPVRNVNWDDAQRYVNWLSSLTGKRYRLPTEAEWEYAARGGPADVGPFAANPYGLEGMTGSLWEWVSDCWHDSYLGAPPDGSNWDEPSCQMRVMRGGASREGVTYIKASTRWRYFPSVREERNGFRVARDLE